MDFVTVQDTNPQIVVLKNLRGSTNRGGNGSYEIRIPVFQRGIVWNESQKQKLIESIKKGYPVGSLMAYQTFESTSGTPKPVWSLIDGLQRTSTILEYLDKPFKVADPGLFISTEHLGEISKILFADDHLDQIPAVTETLKSWLSTIATNNPELGFHAGRLQQYLIEHLLGGVILPQEKSQRLLNYLPEKFFAHINKEIAKIEDASIPIIVYTGPEDQVPEIFERINTQGMKLSKYETFAATWTHKKVKINNEEIRDRIRKKYLALEEQGYVITGIVGDLRELDDFNLFEYLFGLGKVLTDNHKLLFKSSPDSTEPVPIGFVVATIAFREPIAKMKDLAAKLGTIYSGNAINLENFEKALTVSCQAIEDCLRSFLSIRLSSRNRERQFLPHSDNQIFSYIARYMIERFDYNNNWLEKSESRVDELIANIPKLYLRDILDGAWAGSGDSRLFRVTWDNSGDSLRPSNEYLQPISRQDWEGTLSNWHNRELSKLQKERSTVSNEAKMLLKFVYQDIITVSRNENTSFDIEHLWSVSKLREIILLNDSDGWPIGAVSNLALLESSLNQAKGSMMLGDWQETESGRQIPRETWAVVQKLVIHPPIQELKHDKELNREKYLDFCRFRFEELKKILFLHLGL